MATQLGRLLMGLVELGVEPLFLTATILLASRTAHPNCTPVKAAQKEWGGIPLSYPSVCRKPEATSTRGLGKRDDGTAERQQLMSGGVVWQQRRTPPQGSVGLGAGEI